MTLFPLLAALAVASSAADITAKLLQMEIDGLPVRDKAAVQALQAYSARYPELRTPGSFDTSVGDAWTADDCAAQTDSNRRRVGIWESFAQQERLITEMVMKDQDCAAKLAIKPVVIPRIPTNGGNPGPLSPIGDLPAPVPTVDPLCKSLSDGNAEALSWLQQEKGWHAQVDAQSKACAAAVQDHPPTPTPQQKAQMCAEIKKTYDQMTALTAGCAALSIMNPTMAMLCAADAATLAVTKKSAQRYACAL